ncbi:MAG: 50S ribosomal protein L13 [Candidatus Aminicenantes bacterium]|nr:50S ribosomal protein L13 [Candidatus Aminicenantes bacterium]
MKTRVPKKDDIEHKWWLVNAEGKVLGRLASEVAVLLRGKRKAYFTPFLDTGDFVVVVNADKIVVTGDKRGQKVYHSHSGYPGGLKTKSFVEMMAKKPEEVVRRAVWGMIPKNRLGRSLAKKLKVYRGADHPHQAQNPEEHRF